MRDVFPRVDSSVQSFRAPAAPESLFSAWPEKSNPKRGHPAWRLPGVTARRVREPRSGFSTVRPCTDEKAAASCRCPLTRPVDPASPPHRGRRSKASCCVQPCSTKQRTAKRWLAMLPRPCAASAAWLPGPEGDRQEADPFSSVHGRAVEKPSHAARAFRPLAGEKRQAGCRSLWLLSLGQARASHSRAARAPAAVGVGAARYATDIRRVTVFRRAFKTRCGWPLTGIHAVLAECGCWLRTDHG